MDKIRKIIQEIEVLKSQKKYVKAISIIQNTLALNNNDYRLYEELADIYLYTGDIDKARKAIDFALNINSESATGNYLKGFVILSEGEDIKESIKYLEKSNNLIPNNPEVLRNLGWAYTSNNQIIRGIFILKRALNLQPDDILITEDLAMALISNGDIKEGNQLLKKIGKPTKEINI